MHEMLIAKNLAELLNGRAKIYSANNAIVMRPASFNGFDGVSNKQFTLVSIDSKCLRWYVCEGPGISVFEDDYKLKFNQALQELANKIIEFANKKPIRFNLLVMPARSVERANMECLDDILIRYVEAYLPATDNISYRYDVLISKEQENAN